MSIKEKLLVLAVDFDDDLGRNGFKTPVIGFEECFKVAQSFALKRPSDADANTLFTALRIAKELSRKDSPTEVAFVTGHEKGGARAGLKLRDEIKKVVTVTGSSSAILVVDSAEDELVTPVAQSLINIVGIEKVVVEQMRGVEETYILLGRYLRKALEERRFSRFFLGLPGLLILTYVILSITPYSFYAGPLTLTMLGLALVLKGFGFTEDISRLWRASPIMRVSLGLTALALALTTGVAFLSLYSRSFSTDIISLAIYMKVVTPYASLSILPLIVGRLAYRLLKKSVRVWRDIIALSVLGVIYQSIMSISRIILTAGTEDLAQIMKALNENYVVQTLALYIGIIMTVSVTLYAVEKQLS